MSSQKFPIISVGGENNICERSDNSKHLNEKQVKQILDTLRTNFVVDTAFWACCYHQLAVYTYNTDKIVESVNYNKKAEQLRSNFYDGFLWKSKLNIGINYFDLDEYKLAKNYLLKSYSSKGLKRGKDSLNIFRNLGKCYAYLGDIDKGIEYATLATEISLNNSKEDIYSAKNDFSTILIETNETEKIKAAIRHLKEVLYNSKDPYNKGIALDILARANSRLKKFDQALEYYKKSLFSSKNDTFNYAATLNNIAVLYMDKNTGSNGLQYNTAIDTLNKALNLYYTFFGTSTNYFYAALHENLADNYTALQQFDTALLHYQKALINLTNNFRKEDIYQNPNPKDTSLFIYSNPDMIRVLHLKATAAFKYYQQTEEEKYLNLANQTYQAAFDFHDQLQKDISTENSRLFQVKNIVPYIENALKVVYQQQQNGQDVSKTAFRFMEKNKATVLLQSMNEVDALKYANLPDSLLEQEKDLKIALTFHQKQLNDAIEYEDTTEIERLDKIIFDEKQQYSQLINNLENNYPNYYRLKYQQNQTQLVDVQNTLEDKTALLEYFVGDTYLYTLLILKDDAQLFKIKKPAEWNNTIKNFRDAITLSDPEVKDNPYTKKLYSQFIDNGHNLFQYLLKKPLQKIDHISQLKIIPDAALNYIPFDLLLTTTVDSSKINYKTLPYLLKQKTISYTYSATLMMEQLLENSTEKTYAYGGYAPQYTNSTEVDLPGVRQLVNDIALFFKGKSYLNKDATKSNFLKDSLSYQVLHLAMHGEIDDEYPLNSHLVFTKNTKDTLQDNFQLYAADLYLHQLNTDLAVLSACETGTGELQKGEGVMSLSRAFTYAGCPSLVMSLWSIPEKSSVEVLKNFFKNLKKETLKTPKTPKKTPKDVALRQAKLDYLENTSATTSHPVYWAGLVLTGNTEAMHFESTSNKLWWFLTLLIILIGAFYIFKKSYTN